jgi:hypothetical protein
MLSLEAIRGDSRLVNEIDWEMTPELAVSQYLEWGNGWDHVGRMVRSPDQETYYFVVYSWENGPVLHFIRRNTGGAEELAVIELPEELRRGFQEYWGGHKGVYGLTPEIEAWLKDELGLGSVTH